MDPKVLEELLEESIARAHVEDKLTALKGAAFPQQRAFIDDRVKHKALFCTRRAAKSFTAGLYMTETCLEYPESNCLFVGLTRDTARGIIDKDILKTINRTYDLGIIPNKALLEYHFPNGSMIKSVGVDADEEEMNKALGKKYKLVCIDEASLYSVNLQHFVYDILGPAMADQEGTICLFGTSSNFTRGLFFDITNGKEPGWSLHKWSAHQNPHINWQKQLDEIKNNRPLYMETPQFRQWYLNEWVIETDKLVYKFNTEKNLYSGDLPYAGSKGWTYNLSVDTGWEDDNAFVLSGYHENDSTLYVIKCFKKNHMTFDQVEIKIKEFLADPKFPIQSVIIDGANKQGVETMRLRSDIHFEYADKLGKVDHIEILNGDLIQERIKIHVSCNDLIDEMMSLVWRTSGDKIVYPKKEHPSLPNHLCFVAGTKVMTPNGDVNIEELKEGDLVETRKGPRAIEYTISRESEVVVMTMSNGVQITCTPDHPFWSNGKWIAAQDLTTMDLLFTWEELQRQNELNLKTPNIADKLIAFILGLGVTEKPLSFIARYGNIIVVKFQLAFIFITKITTPWITGLKIWNVYPRVATRNNTLNLDLFGVASRKISNSSSRYGLSQKFGTLLKKVGNGILNTLSRLSIHLRSALRLILLISPESAEIMELTMSRGYVQIVQRNLVPTNTASKNAAVYLVQRSTGGSKKVYNISVSDVHEYFVEGILTENCDAFLYGWFNGWHFLSTPAKKALMPGTPEYIKEQEDLHKQAIMEKIQREERMKDVGQQGLTWERGASGGNSWNDW